MTLESNSSKKLNIEYYYKSLLGIYTDFLFNNPDIDNIFLEEIPDDHYFLYRAMNNQTWKNFSSGISFQKI